MSCSIGRILARSTVHQAERLFFNGASQNRRLATSSKDSCSDRSLNTDKKVDEVNQNVMVLRKQLEEAKLKYELRNYHNALQDPYHGRQDCYDDTCTLGGIIVGVGLLLSVPVITNMLWNYHFKRVAAQTQAEYEMAQRRNKRS